MDGRNAAGVAGAPHFDEVEGFAAAHLADDHAVSRRRIVARTSSVMVTTPARVRSGTWSRAAHCSSMVSSSTSTRSPVAAIRPAARSPAWSCRCWCRRRLDVLPLAHGAAQELGLPGGQDAVGHVAIRPMMLTARLRSAKAGPGRPEAGCPRNARRFPATRRSRAAGRDAPPRRHARRPCG